MCLTVLFAKNKSNIDRVFVFLKTRLKSKMVLFILTVSILLWFVYTFFKEECMLLRKIPMPDGSVPLFGHVWTFVREKNHLKLMQDWSEKYGPIFRFNRGFGKWNSSL